jgi:hypothetical protein
MRARPRSRENHGSRRRHPAIPHEAAPLARTLNAHSKKSTHQPPQQPNIQVLLYGTGSTVARTTEMISEINDLGCHLGEFR